MITKDRLEESAALFADGMAKIPHYDSNFFSGTMKTYGNNLTKIDGLLEAYRDGNRGAINETITGGLFLTRQELDTVGFFARTPFSNETIANELRTINSDYSIFENIFKQINPPDFFVELETLADKYLIEALSIRRELLKKVNSELYDAGKEATVIDDETRNVPNISVPRNKKDDFKKAYIDQEFEMRDEIINLLDKYKSLYETVHELMRQSLEIYNRKLHT